jgi:hypothetical protein
MSQSFPLNSACVALPLLTCEFEMAAASKAASVINSRIMFLSIYIYSVKLVLEVKMVLRFFRKKC